VNPAIYNSSLLHWIYPGAIWNIPTDEKVVYLTFDDGPHATITPWVMDLLETYGMKATFFCIGDNAAANPEIIKQLVSNGHALGNHTQHHLNGFYNSAKTYLKEIEECENYISSNLFRPPYGRMRRSQLNLIKRTQKYKIIMWSILSGDFFDSLKVNKTLAHMKKITKPGSIILFHDSLKAEKNLRIMLPEYLDYLASQGFVSKAVVL
jgi:peptidoglycan-N-acetylglucosamine deacetylase